MVDFCIFICIPVADRKRESIFESTSASYLCPLQKMKMPSTKSRCVILWLVVIRIPWNPPILIAFKISLLNPSATSKKRSGERGHPW
jgi:hypothetical protein